MSYVQVVALGTPYTRSMPGGVPLATCALPVGMVIGHGLLTLLLCYLLTRKPEAHCALTHSLSTLSR